MDFFFKNIVLKPVRKMLNLRLLAIKDIVTLMWFPDESNIFVALV